MVHTADAVVDQARVAVDSLKPRLHALQADVDADVDWLRSPETRAKLQSLARSVDLAIAAVDTKYGEALRGYNNQLAGSFGLGLLKLMAHVVLVGTGNFAAAQWLGHAEKAVKAATSIAKPAGADAQALARMESVSKAFGDVKSGVKNMEDLLADKPADEQVGTITGPDGLSLDITFTKPAKKAELGIGKAVEAILPVVEQIGDLVQLGQKLSRAQADYGGDSVMLAMRAGTYNKLIEKLIAEAGSDGEDLKKAIDEYTAKVQERNAFLLEHRARWLKVSELHAQAALTSAQLLRWGAEAARTRNVRVVGMSSFWAQIYDVIRDRILDLIYEAYRAYVYRTLDERPFSRFSPTELAADTQSEAVRRIATQIAQVGVNQSVVTLELLHESLRRAHRALDDQAVVARVDVKNESGRVVFERSAHQRQFEELQTTGEAMFFVSPDAKAFARLAHLHVTEVKAFIPGATAQDSVCVELVHSRVVAVKDLAGHTHQFHHGPVEVLVYAYRIVPVAAGAAKPEPGVYRYRDMERSEDYIEVTSSSLTNANQLAVNPCTWWRVRLPKENNLGLNLDGATRLVLQFTGGARHISSGAAVDGPG